MANLNVEGLKEIYVALGGSADDVAGISTIPEMLTAIAPYAQASAAELPAVTSSDNGKKTLGVANGKWAAVNNFVVAKACIDDTTEDFYHTYSSMKILDLLRSKISGDDVAPYMYESIVIINQDGTSKIKLDGDDEGTESDFTRANLMNIANRSSDGMGCGNLLFEIPTNLGGNIHSYNKFVATDYSIGWKGITSADNVIIVRATKDDGSQVILKGAQDANAKIVFTNITPA